MAADQIKASYKSLIGGLREMRAAYTAVAVIPDDELDAAQRLHKHVVIEAHREFVRETAEALDDLINRVRKLSDAGNQGGSK